MSKYIPVIMIRCQDCGRHFSGNFNMCAYCGWTTEDKCKQVYKPINGKNNINH